jgi:hypothetical protein
MKYHLTKFATLIGLTLMLILQACNLSTTAGETPVPIPTATPTHVQEVEGQCANPLFPVKLGAIWTYTGTGSTAGDYGFTDTITDVRDDGFTLTSQFDDLTRTQEWTCKPEGLAALTFGGGAAGGIFANGMQMDLNTSNVQGVNLPKTINAGDQWPYSLDFEGDMEFSGTQANAQGTATFTFTAVGQESVTVPAGTFDAMKIHADMVLDMQLSLSGITTPVTFTSPTDLWFAPSVGWIKATSAGELMGMSFNETIELQSYNIP